MKAAGKGGSKIPGLVFCALGLVPLVIGLYLAADRAVVLLSWREAAATVVDSRIETRGSQHAARIRVRFESEDGPVEAEAVHDQNSSDYASIAETLELYPRGGEATVHYDPDDPRRARLDAGFNLATFGMSLILLAAGAVLLGIGALALRAGRLSHEASVASSAEAKAQARRREVWTVGLFVLAIGAVMALGGAAMVPGALEERTWPVATATVEKSNIYTRSSSRSGKHGGSVTYYVARLYLSYEHEGRTLLAPLDAGSFQDKRKTERLLASIPIGDRREVRVHPRRPHRIRPMNDWPLALPAVFLVAGGLVVVVAVSVIRRYALTSRRGA
jgi:hypothetical protein